MRDDFCMGDETVETVLGILRAQGVEAEHYGHGQFEVNTPLDMLLTVTDMGNGVFTVEVNAPVRDIDECLCDVRFVGHTTIGLVGDILNTYMGEV
jgi:hypothetical protein